MSSAVISPTPPPKALHTWSLFRTLGRYVAAGSMPSGDLPEGGGSELALLDLPAELARRGYKAAQLCHFYLASRHTGYLTNRAARSVRRGRRRDRMPADR